MTCSHVHCMIDIQQCTMAVTCKSMHDIMAFHFHGLCAWLLNFCFTPRAWPPVDSMARLQFSIPADAEDCFHVGMGYYIWWVIYISHHEPPSNNDIYFDSYIEIWWVYIRTLEVVSLGQESEKTLYAELLDSGMFKDCAGSWMELWQQRKTACLIYIFLEKICSYMNLLMDEDFQ